MRARTTGEKPTTIVRLVDRDLDDEGKDKYEKSTRMIRLGDRHLDDEGKDNRGELNKLGIVIVVLRARTKRRHQQIRLFRLGDRDLDDEGNGREEMGWLRGTGGAMGWGELEGVLICDYTAKALSTRFVYPANALSTSFAYPANARFAYVPRERPEALTTHTPPKPIFPRTPPIP